MIEFIIPSILVSIAILVVIGIAIFNLNIRDKIIRYCPKCKRKSYRLILDNSTSNSVERMYPSRFKYRKYQRTYMCDICKYTGTKILFQGKNEEGNF
jgi:hypothetical protein